MKNKPKTVRINGAMYAAECSKCGQRHAFASEPNLLPHQIFCECLHKFSKGVI